MISIYKPYKIEYSKKYVIEAIDNNIISWTGKYVNKCEQLLSQITKIPYVLLTNNGTSATHCIIKAIKYKYPSCKKIYIPNNCYIAVYNTVLLEYNDTNIEILPIDKETLNINLDILNELEYNACLVLVHNIGNIIPVHEIKRLRPDLIIVEDNCEGFMGKYNKQYTGTMCLASSISFYPNKHITCGEGGAFMTHDIDVFNYIKRIR